MAGTDKAKIAELERTVAVLSRKLARAQTVILDKAAEYSVGLAMRLQAVEAEHGTIKSDVADLKRRIPPVSNGTVTR